MPDHEKEIAQRRDRQIQLRQGMLVCTAVDLLKPSNAHTEFYNLQDISTKQAEAHKHTDHKQCVGQREQCNIVSVNVRYRGSS